jgi:hypothetical protein
VDKDAIRAMNHLNFEAQGLGHSVPEVGAASANLAGPPLMPKWEETMSKLLVRVGVCYLSQPSRT